MGILPMSIHQQYARVTGESSTAMKRLLILVPIVLLATDLRAERWKLIWSDEFNYTGLPDDKKWDYEEGFVRNHELQYYTRKRAANARVKDGNLIITGRKEKFPNARHRPGSKGWQSGRKEARYTAASLITRNRFSFLYGRIEVRARLPRGKGVWPAIWTLGTNRSVNRWPRCGEIDIMEYVGKDPHRVHANAHYAVNGRHRSKGGKHKTKAPYEAFHIYAIEWFPDRIDFYFDKVKYFTFPIDHAGKGPENPFRKPHYLLINLALGGSWGGAMDDKVLPQQYLIDYVRIYKQVPARRTERPGSGAARDAHAGAGTATRCTARTG